jgi:hypothetical protein
VELLLPARAPLALLRAAPSAFPQLRRPERVFGLNPSGPVGRGALIELIGACRSLTATRRRCWLPP